MKIALGTVMLCAGGSDSPRGLVVDGQTQTQWLEAIRAAAANPVNRGNSRTSISFELDREHPDLIAAQKFLFTHFAALADLQDLLIITLDDDNRAYVSNCKVESARGQIEGVSTVFSYRLVGAGMTLTNPN